MRKVVIAGCGYTGSRVANALGDGRVIAFRRHPERGGSLPFDLDFPGDRDAPALPLPAEYDLLYTIPPARDDDADTDRRLARLLALLDPLPRRFVYLSTSGVYGDCAGALVDESRQPRPATARAKRRLVAEGQLQRFTTGRGVSLVVLRVPGIYGPGRLGINRIRSGMPVLVEADAHPGNRIHVDDLAASCLAALSQEAPPGVYNVSDGDHRSGSWFTLTVARLAGLPAPRQVSRDEARRTFGQSRLSFLEESRRLDNRRMREVLRVEPRYADAEAGIRASLVEEPEVNAVETPPVGAAPGRE